MLLPNLNHKILFWSPFGSKNYNLNDSTSDNDIKIYVLPTFEDLYFRKEFSDSNVGKHLDHDAHDIRKLAVLLWKSNINFMETIFTMKVQPINEYTTNEILKLYKNRNKLAKMNLPYLWDSCMGMHNQKFANLEKGTEGTRDLVERYGYDTKQALHCYRCLDFLQKFLDNNFNDFEDAIFYDYGDERNFMLSIKYGAYNLEKFKELAIEKRLKIESLKDIYKSQTANEELKDWLDDLILNIIKYNLINI